MKTLLVKKIFSSLQGEGANTGKAAIFIRLSGCNLECYFCDTDFKGGIRMTLEEIKNNIKDLSGGFIVWTGGEPTLQLTDEVVDYFHHAGYVQAIESNGLLPIPLGIDWKVVSPKENLEEVKRANPNVDELRIPFIAGVPVPSPEDLPTADFYIVSPVFDGDKVNKKNVKGAVDFVLDNPAWAISLQLHKILNIE